MCGRFTITLTKTDFIKYLSGYKDLEVNIDNLDMPAYNVSPSEQVIAMIPVNQGFRVGSIKWGYIPDFTKDLKSVPMIINARSESLLEKKSFKNAIISNRCVIFADSFYEWKKVNGKKIPYRIQLHNQEVFAFAALWSRYKDIDKSIFTAAIITTASTDIMSSIHDRMPVILTKNEIINWLNPNLNDPFAYLKAHQCNQLEAYEVGNYVNLSTHKDMTCIRPLKNT